MLKELISEVENLKRAMDLLEKVFHEIGPYGSGTLDPQTLGDLRSFFKFDDSE